MSRYDDPDLARRDAESTVTAVAATTFVSTAVGAAVGARAVGGVSGIVAGAGLGWLGARVLNANTVQAFEERQKARQAGVEAP